jgi:hypothetical protein
VVGVVGRRLHQVAYFTGQHGQPVGPASVSVGTFCHVTEIAMSLNPFQSVAFPQKGRSRLTHARLRQPTPLPSLKARGLDSPGYLRRLLWIFGGA